MAARFGRPGCRNRESAVLYSARGAVGLLLLPKLQPSRIAALSGNHPNKGKGLFVLEGTNVGEALLVLGTARCVYLWVWL